MPSDPAAVAARRAVREAVLAALYAQETGGAYEAPEGLPPAARARFDAQTAAIAADPGRWDGAISGHLAPGWSVGRLGVVDRILLRMACWELWEAPEVPMRVTIAEHVSLAKRFGDKASSGFVHAVLAKVAADSPKAGGGPAEETDEGWLPAAPGKRAARTGPWKVRAGAE